MSPSPSTAVATLFADYGGAMRARARRVTGSEADAEEVVQDVMLILLTAPNVLAPVERMGGWLLTMVQRRALDLLRSTGRRRAREEAEGIEDLFAELPDPDMVLARDETARAVARAVEALPPEQREVFQASALDGWSFRELSEETGVPMGTLMARKKRAMDNIRARLRREGLLPPLAAAERGGTT
ncbi:MAG: RNA polymerase sigma factor [Pseudomonadota bacterium]